MSPKSSPTRLAAAVAIAAALVPMSALPAWAISCTLFHPLTQVFTLRAVGGPFFFTGNNMIAIDAVNGDKIILTTQVSSPNGGNVNNVVTNDGVGNTISGTGTSTQTIMAGSGAVVNLIPVIGALINNIPAGGTFNVTATVTCMPAAGNNQAGADTGDDNTGGDNNTGDDSPEVRQLIARANGFATQVVPGAFDPNAARHFGIPAFGAGVGGQFLGGLGGGAFPDPNPIPGAPLPIDFPPGNQACVDEINKLRARLAEINAEIAALEANPPDPDKVGKKREGQSEPAELTKKRAELAQAAAAEKALEKALADVQTLREHLLKNGGFNKRLNQANAEKFTDKLKGADAAVNELVAAGKKVDKGNAEINAEFGQQMAFSLMGGAFGVVLKNTVKTAKKGKELANKTDNFVEGFVRNRADALGLPPTPDNLVKGGKEFLRKGNKAKKEAQDRVADLQKQIDTGNFKPKQPRKKDALDFADEEAGDFGDLADDSFDSLDDLDDLGDNLADNAKRELGVAKAQVEIAQDKIDAAKELIDKAEKARKSALEGLAGAGVVQGVEAGQDALSDNLADKAVAVGGFIADFFGVSAVYNFAEKQLLGGARDGSLGRAINVTSRQLRAAENAAQEKRERLEAEAIALQNQAHNQRVQDKISERNRLQKQIADLIRKCFGGQQQAAAQSANAVQVAHGESSGPAVLTAYSSGLTGRFELRRWRAHRLGNSDGKTFPDIFADERFNLWLQTSAAFHQDSSASDQDGATVTVAGGASWQFAPNLTAGLTGSYGYTELDGSAGDDIKANTFSIGAFAQTRLLQKVLLSALAAYTHSRADARFAPPIGTNTNANFDTNAFTGQLQLSRRFVFGETTVTPTAGATFVHINQASFSLSDGTAIPKTTINQFSMSLGTSISRQIVMPQRDLVITPSLSVSGYWSTRDLNNAAITAAGGAGSLGTFGSSIVGSIGIVRRRDGLSVNLSTGVSGIGGNQQTYSANADVRVPLN